MDYAWYPSEQVNRNQKKIRAAVNDSIFDVLGRFPNCSRHAAPSVVLYAKIRIVPRHRPDEARKEPFRGADPSHRTMADASFPVINKPVALVAQSDAKVRIFPPGTSSRVFSVESTNLHKSFTPERHIAAGQMVHFL